LPLTPFPRPRTERELSALGTPFILLVSELFIFLVSLIQLASLSSVMLKTQYISILFLLMSSRLRD